MQELSGLPEQLMAYQEGLSSMESLILGTKYYYDQIKDSKISSSHSQHINAKH